MMPSVDGRIKTDRWNLSAGYAEYDRVGDTHRADAWMCGRVTMEAYAAPGRPRLRKPAAPIPRTDFVARKSGSYGIALDQHGKLNWKSDEVNGDQLITVLSTAVPDPYLEFLRAKGISYLFGGGKRLNLARVLEKLREEFGIKRLLLEGGGGINGSMLRAGLIDELSILVVPVADGSLGTPTLFDGGGREGTKLTLMATRKLTGGVVWLRYRVRK